MAATKYRFVDHQDFSLPSGKDGFLAMNSLLAFGLLLTRVRAAGIPACAFPPLLSQTARAGPAPGWIADSAGTGARSAARSRGGERAASGEGEPRPR